MVLHDFNGFLLVAGDISVQGQQAEGFLANVHSSCSHTVIDSFQLGSQHSSSWIINSGGS